MSPDILATILSAVGVLLAMAGGFGWVITRFDSRLDAGLSGLEQRLSARIDGVEACNEETGRRLSARIDGVESGLEQRLSARIDALDVRLSDRIDGVETGLEQRLSARIDALDARLSTRIDALSDEVGGLRGDVTELKVAVARLEGPARPPLLMLG
ncbi:apolipoprotein A1/A4/E family protein [Leucobacter tenebrionis]|uniref:apolipoprotein A1/A4/E family protein n=1 Tax=Leucobacter tenebrionis TaxID=2873270 RepID=UPI001CA6F3C5|nr:apolipoprotein A1/A4/E family protein [Leucobacter tenebrionis]QZY52828.1 apolipoprotein A1/A4/E family protein [Leucobacter tenebrionis]